MLTRKVSVHRKARYAVRLPDTTRPHGRRRGYAHTRPDHHAPEHRREFTPLGARLALGGVLLFLALVIAGALAPRGGPLVKHEPVSTARMR